MKKLLLLVIVVLLVVTMCCCCPKRKDMKPSEDSQLVAVETFYNGYTTCSVYYDRHTKVMYFSQHESGITPLYNEDGTLRLWEEQK